MALDDIVLFQFPVDRHPRPMETGIEESVSVALRFTLSVAAVSTAIVETTRPERWSDNARLLQDGLLPVEQFERIRARWRQVVGST